MKREEMIRARKEWVERLVARCRKAGIPLDPCDNPSGYALQVFNKRLRSRVGKYLHNALEAGDMGLDRYWRPRNQDAPTAHRPGSPEKVAVLAARLEAGQALWHEDDAMLEPAWEDAA